jgi:CheY-like chemotaxis protein
MKVLIADDDDVSRLALRSMVKKRGYEVVEASNGAEAWQALLADDPPQLATLDWLMPEVSGVELCRRVRTTPHLATTYLILLTAQDSKDRVIEGWKPAPTIT